MPSLITILNALYKQHLRGNMIDIGIFLIIRRRGYVIPEDVRAVCHDVLRHRIGLTYEAEAENITTEEIITDILNNVIVP